MTNSDWAAWAGRRPEPRILHLDAAAAGRASTATLAAAASHARLEAEIGAYAAQEAAASTIEQLRTDLAALTGLSADGVALTVSATSALNALLAAWPLAPGSTIGVLPSEWGPNLETFETAGLKPLALSAGPDGRLDLDGLDELLSSGAAPAVVHVTLVPAHRGLRQSIAEIGARCRRAGAPLWVDAAQGLGQCPPVAGADAVYGTSRKWLCGPRGVGVLGISEAHWQRLRVLRREKFPDDRPVVHMLEPEEAHIAGLVGLAVAVGELMRDGPEAVAERLAEVGDHAREALAELDGWEVVEHQTGPITALRPTLGQDVAAVRDRLLAEHGVLVTVSQTWRAADLDRAWLRLSPHVDCTDDDLNRMVRALHAVTAS